MPKRRPSPAMIIAVIALVLGLGGAAVAADLSKNKVKKIAKQQANKQIKKKAPNLRVAHARTADDATNATNLTGGGDAKNLISGYATLNGDDPASVINFGGKRVTGVSVTRNLTGEYEVFLNGSFPGVTSMDQVYATANTWDTDNFNECELSADGSVASATQIELHVFCWRNNAQPPVASDTDFTVSVQTP